MTWAKLRMPAGVAACGGICGRVAIGTGVMESVPSGLRGYSDSPAAVSGCFPGVLCWEAEAEVMREASFSCFMTPMNYRIITAVMLLEGPAVMLEGVGLV